MTERRNTEEYVVVRYRYLPAILVALFAAVLTAVSLDGSPIAKVSVGGLVAIIAGLLTLAALTDRTPPEDDHDLP